MQTIRTLLVDDHTVLRAGLKLLLGKQPDFEVVADVANVVDAGREVVALRPDLVVLDLSIPGGGSLEFIEQIQHEVPGTHVLILTMHDDPAYARAALGAGANGYVVKTIGESQLLAAMRTVSKGQLFVDLDNPTRTMGVLAKANRRIESGRKRSRLTRREIEVLRLLGQGHGNKTIATQLGISAKTIATYKARIAEKLGIRTTAEFVKYAADNREMTNLDLT